MDNEQAVAPDPVGGLGWIRQFRVKKLWVHPITQNLLGIYAVQAANIAVPLLTVPYLTRVLQPTGWGLFGFAQSFGLSLGVVAEYGFWLSANREVARHRDDRDKLSTIVAGVMGAKALLAVGAIVIGLLVEPVIPLFRQHPRLLWAAVFWSISQGYNMLWYYQGTERIWRMASFDVFFKASALAAIFLFVKGPGDEAKALALGALGWFLSAVVTAIIAYREVGFRRPTLALCWNALRMGWSMFLFRTAFILYSSGNGFILGLFAAPAQVGYYTGAEKIGKGLLTPLSPLSQAVFPRVSYLAVHSRNRAARVARFSLIVMCLGGFLLGGVAFFFAPLIIRIVLGPHFQPSVPVLRILAGLAPAMAISLALGIQWMLPLGLDDAFNRIILCAGILNIVLAVFLAPLYGQMGMACSVLTCEIFVAIGMYIALRRRGLDPLTYSQGS
ncbi:MAG TPA: flippase [Terriglobia bacterium]|nr:flippase [Terriglobia bacterium]